MSYVSKLDKDMNTRIPKEIIESAGLKPGIEIIWMFDEDTRQILLMEKPENFAKALRGMGKEMWEKVEVNEYIQEERNTWE
jgi:hypothetical protein